ncbi:HTTM domain-containing protein [Granulicella sp. WH15]|uniref:HTTM domain-containing protein n=1 Tax=Granulicella sp. WH15 TaxID=2602070 RepID=UPI0013A5812D|nr:HTTM domain-containing protein [Granulicella sp. WH15]
MPTNLAVMVKVLAIAVLVTNHVRLLPDPWLSFIPPIDSLPPVFFQKTIQVVFVISALAILFNRRIQWASLVIGSTMLLSVVSSKAYYGNNKTFCGLMFFLAGLYKPGGPPFIRWQLALTYFGAGLNKLLDQDWQTGVFFEFWSVHKLHEQAYLALDALLPRMWLARFMCWFTIVTELGVVPFLLISRIYFWGVLLNVLFQCGLCLFVGNTFTLFFYGMNAASFAFVTWPSSPMKATYDPAHRMTAALQKLLEWIDLDHRVIWTPLPITGAVPLELAAEGRSYSGFRALRMIVLFNPVTYLVFTAAMAASGNGESLGLAIYRRVLVGTALVLLMPPLAWIADRISGGGLTSAGAQHRDQWRVSPLG